MVIQTKKGNINVPMTAQEIRYADFLPYHAAVKAMYSEATDTGEGYELPLEKSIEHITAAVNSYFKYDKESLATVQELPFEHEKGGFGFGKHITVCAIYWQLYDLIMNYQPKESKRFSFKLGGSTFEIGNNSIGNLAEYEFRKQLKQPLELTGGEVTEVLALRTLIQEQVKEMEGQPKLDLIYTGDIRQIAILCRRKAEKLPSGFAERQAFVDARVQLFKDLDMATILDANFFLSDTIMKSLQTKLTTYFLKVSKANAKVKQPSKLRIA